LNFTDLNVNDVRTLDFGMGASVWKKGANNEINLQLNKIDYHYNNGQAPTTSGALTLKLDLVKALGQKSLNEVAEQLQLMAQKYASVFAAKYGEAFSLSIDTKDLQKDQQGNVVSASFSLDSSIDLSKLPASVKAEDVEYKSLKAEISLNRAGVGASFAVVLNTQNKSFSSDQVGLEEYIVSLLKDDESAFSSVDRVAGFLNSIADTLVNVDNSAQ
ncbi:MAG TPA: hypothetical protein VN132_10595, partial [Bdellovibrio sp.]|nr:hypothetical protein [Bdellovibrio sp.]